MNSIIKISSALAALAILACGCKKDEENTIGNYLSGSLNFDFPTYVQYGDRITSTPRGVYHPDAPLNDDGTAKDILGYFYICSYNSVTDTVKKFTDPAGAPKSFTVAIDKDTVGTFLISAYAYAPDYYNSAKTKSFTIVKEGYGKGYSLDGFTFSTDDPGVTAYGRKFYTVDCAGKTWFRENLRGGLTGTGYDNLNAMKGITGCLYSWHEAKEACPEGYTLPTLKEWEALAGSTENIGELLGNLTFNGEEMWTYWPEVKISDKTRMSIIPAGYGVRNGTQARFSDFRKRAVFWAADEQDDSNAFSVSIYQDKNKLFSESMDKESFLASVRCVSK